ncbi:transposase [Deinococcus marmoris]|uniref:transposase n=1 Tax=Deinococcus marmoris TaxID=249408 RepID=UPI0009DCF7EC|nr:transposase [Deinococcus marmoris]
MQTPQFTEDQIIKLLQDGKKGEKPSEDLCRDFGCSTAFYQSWKKKYGDTNAGEAKRLRRLERENVRLLRIVGQQRLERGAMQDVIGEKRSRPPKNAPWPDSWSRRTSSPNGLVFWWVCPHYPTLFLEAV